LSDVKLVALCSNGPQAGKSTAANVLIREKGFVRVKFADVLKRMAGVFLEPFADTDEHVDRMLEGALKEEPIPRLNGSVTPRHVMVTLGTQWGRNLIDPSVWVLATVNKVKSLLANGKSVVIDDMRFPNELAAVRTLGGKVLFIDRPGFSQHGTCEGLISRVDADWSIANISSKEDFEYGLRNFFVNL